MDPDDVLDLRMGGRDHEIFERGLVDVTLWRFLDTTCWQRWKVFVTPEYDYKTEDDFCWRAEQREEEIECYRK